MAASYGRDWAGVVDKKAVNFPMENQSISNEPMNRVRSAKRPPGCWAGGHQAACLGRHFFSRFGCDVGTRSRGKQRRNVFFLDNTGSTRLGELGHSMLHSFDARFERKSRCVCLPRKFFVG